MSIDSLFGGILGTPLCPLNQLYPQPGPMTLAQQNAQAAGYRNSVGSGEWGSDYSAYYAQLEKQNRERFYRSCSQNWLNAMLDVELGI